MASKKSDDLSPPPIPLSSFFQKLLPGGWKAEAGDRRSFSRYLRLWRVTVLLIASVSIAPLVIVGALDFYQDQQALKDEIARPLLALTSATKHSIERFVEERSAALNYVVNEKPYEELSDQDTLLRTFNNLRKSFGGFVDLGLIDSAGKQITYVGPYDLLGKNYADQEWFHEILNRGTYISDTFLGHRGLPHFVIAVKHKREDGGFHILRATSDTAILSRHVPSLSLGLTGDAFIINREGILQTPSQFYGETLTAVALAVPAPSKDPVVQEVRGPDGHSYMVGYAYIDQSPFISVIMKRSDDLVGSWFTLRARRLGFLAVSVGVILILTMGTASYLVSRIREADMRRAKLLHDVEYTNKMASVGRLAAGVAHEVNNPLAIISEKAGLVKDILTLTQDYPQREKFLGLVDSILNSVERCSSITHRLLGFSRRSETRIETIDLKSLIAEVLSFLEKEIGYRNITVDMEVPEDLPSIESDRGQLQQVFLNIINNAIEELGDGGRIDISLKSTDDDMVAATIADNGRGIAEEDLKRIFEPFFTTKMEYGTGLGLSITYGIVSRLGGSLEVESVVGQGASFTVKLPTHYTAA